MLHMFCIAHLIYRIREALLQCMVQGAQQACTRSRWKVLCTLVVLCITTD